MHRFFEGSAVLQAFWNGLLNHILVEQDKKCANMLAIFNNLGSKVKKT
jgi:hypothetical protein